MMMHDFHGFWIMTFQSVADIAYFWIAVTEIIQCLPLSVTSETLAETYLKTRQVQAC